MNGRYRLGFATQRLIGVALIVYATLLSGCGGAPVPEEHFYRLPVGTGPALQAPPLPGVLMVQRFTADAVISQRPMAFAEQPDVYDLKQYHYHVWADAPPKLLQEVTVNYLRERGVAGQVTTDSARVLGSYELAGKINHLEHLRGKVPKVNVEIEFSLVRLSDNELIWSDTFGGDRPVGDVTVGGAVKAMGQGFETILDQLVSRIERQ